MLITGQKDQQKSNSIPESSEPSTRIAQENPRLQEAFTLGQNTKASPEKVIEGVAWNCIGRAAEKADGKIVELLPASTWNH